MCRLGAGAGVSCNISSKKLTVQGERSAATKKVGRKSLVGFLLILDTVDI